MKNSVQDDASYQLFLKSQIFLCIFETHRDRGNIDLGTHRDIGNIGFYGNLCFLCPYVFPNLCFLCPYVFQKMVKRRFCQPKMSILRYPNRFSYRVANPKMKIILCIALTIRTNRTCGAVF
jgi:hypothetical protein